MARTTKSSAYFVSGGEGDATADADDSTTSIGRYRESHDALARAPRVLILGAGPVGLELAGEISSAWPDKHVTILEPQPDIVTGPFKQELRDELRRQLAERNIELLLSEALEKEPPTPPTTNGSFTVRTSSGRTIEAKIWFRCYGVHPVSDYLTGELATARRADGFIEVTPTLQVAGQATVFALGDVSSIDSKMAGRATRQADTVATNIRALINGTALADYEPSLPAILIPLGPDGGAAQLPGQEEIAGAATAAEYKGRDLFVDRYRELFRLEAAPIQR